MEAHILFHAFLILGILAILWLLIKNLGDTQSVILLILFAIIIATIDPTTKEILLPLIELIKSLYK